MIKYRLASNNFKEVTKVDFLLFYKNEVFKINYRAPSNQFAKYIPDVEKMITSFRIKE